MTKLRTIAKAGGWEVAQDANGIVSIHFGSGQWICDHSSAYEAIREEVKDPTLRAELLKQWAADIAAATQAEQATPVVEKLLGKPVVSKDLVEELGS